MGLIITHFPGRITNSSNSIITFIIGEAKPIACFFIISSCKKLCLHEISLRAIWNGNHFWSFNLLSLFLWNIRMRRCFFQIISYWASVCITLIVKLAAINSILGVFHVNSHKRLTRNRTETISFCQKWNLM